MILKIFSKGFLLNGKTYFVSDDVEKSRVLEVFQDLQADQSHLSPWEGNGANHCENPFWNIWRGGMWLGVVSMDFWGGNSV